MGRNLDPKCKQCRRIGEKLFLKGERCSSIKCEIVKRNYPPGPHGPKGKFGSQSDFGMQMKEKQKAKKYYNMMEKQFRLTFEQAKKKKGDVGKDFLRSLEMRLDNAVFRSGFADSRLTSRQLVNHGLFTVNGKKADIPSMKIKAGDIIAVKDNKRQAKNFKDFESKVKSRELPSWIHLDAKKLESKILHEPTEEDLARNNINVHVIVEFYSR